MNKIIKIREKFNKIISKNFQVLVYHHIFTKEEIQKRKEMEDKLALEVFMHTELEIFKKQILEFKKRKYNFLTIEEIFNKIENNTITKKDIAITFDDGYKDLYTNVYPFLKSENLKASVFINTNTIGLEDFLSEDNLKEIDEVIKVYSHGKEHINFKTEYESIIKNKNLNENEKTEYIKNLINNIKEPIEYINKLTNTNRKYVFCYPYGEYNKEFDDILLKENIYRVYTNSLVNNLYILKKNNKNILNREYPYSQGYFKIILKKIYRSIRYL